MSSKITEVQHRHMEKRTAGYERQLRWLASELLIIDERERRHIATNLHESISQDLVAVTLKLAGMQKDASPSLSSKLNDVGTLLNQIIKDTRSLTVEISPPALYEFGLEAGLQALSDDLYTRYGLEVLITDDGVDKPLGEDVRILLFRGVQELLQNVLKHARVNQARVHLVRKNNDIVIVVEDEGVGFDPAILGSYDEKVGKFGLFNLKERIAFLNGTFQVETSPGGGTRVTMRAPLKRAD